MRSAAAIQGPLRNKPPLTPGRDAGEHIISDDRVFDVVAHSDLTAYDAEFVALATALGVPLVTADKAVLKAFPQQALSMEGFLDARGLSGR